MPALPAVQPEQISKETLHKTRLLLESMRKQLSSPAGKGARILSTEIKLDWDLAKNASKLMAAENPMRGSVLVVTAFMVQKGTAAASITSQSQLAECSNAIASLGGDLAVAAVLGPETAGLGSVVPLLQAAFDSYQVGKSCFVVDGHVTHAVRPDRPLP